MVGRIWKHGASGSGESICTPEDCIPAAALRETLCSTGAQSEGIEQRTGANWSA